MFKYVGNLNGGHARTLKTVLLDGSETFTVGDMVCSTGLGAVVPATAGATLLGVITAIVTSKGVPPADNGAGADYSDTYTTAASNVATEQVSAEIDIDPNSLYSVGLDASFGTTANGLFKYYKLANETTLNESTVSSSREQVFCLNLDPNDSTRVVVKIAESVL